MWIGVWHDKNYTYVANGTKETNNATFVPWPYLNPSGGCGLLDDEFYADFCGNNRHLALCEKPVCGN